MKRWYLWVVILALLCSWSFAQQNEVEKMVNANLDASQLAEKSKNIQDIDVSFCDKYWEKSVIYDVSLWKEHDICLNLFNGSNQDVIIKLLFVDGMLTNDQWQNKACGNNDDVDWFGQYVTWYQSTISLKKDETKTNYAYLNLPNDFSGSNIEWCLVYSLLSDNSNWSGSVWFDIVVRKAKFITLNIIKKVPSFDFRYLSIVVLIVLFLIFRKKWFTNK